MRLDDAQWFEVVESLTLPLPPRANSSAVSVRPFFFLSSPFFNILFILRVTDAEAAPGVGALVRERRYAEPKLFSVQCCAYVCLLHSPPAAWDGRWLQRDRRFEAKSTGYWYLNGCRFRE